MAKKKGFSKLVQQQKQAGSEQESLDRLAKRVKRNFKDKVGGLVINPKGEAKMSEVLEAFVEPYIGDHLTLNQRQSLFQIAVIAWNIPLLPEEEQQSAQDMIIQQLSDGRDPQFQLEVQEMVAELVERKRTQFAQHKRYIFDFELKETKDQFHLSVVSSMSDSKKS
ncbi:hypothetical protein [Leptolyngbya sp. FACHB-16]|uniref:hypothetical protein n=1 Tax=unclassified Leptolyngbya TaxID=2650499 RepID=UPI0016864C81|nr:hypothetical protein [Leptolyngbya sp. FACHB-16]MBD2156163.1 hypothetical protein [Leptolyngbya sp. FACHB-16]